MDTTTTPIVTQPPPDVVHMPGDAVRVVPFKIQERDVDRVASVYEPRSEHRPEQILLGTLGHQGFRVIKPIKVNLEARETAVVASWEEIDEFGTGASISSAADDLGRTVAELYCSLQSEQGNLGPDLQRVWAKLQEYVVPRR